MKDRLYLSQNEEMEKSQKNENYLSQNKEMKKSQRNEIRSSQSETRSTIFYSDFQSLPPPPQRRLKDVEVCLEHSREILCLSTQHKAPLCIKCIESHGKENYEEYTFLKSKIKKGLNQSKIELEYLQDQGKKMKEFMKNKMEYLMKSKDLEKDGFQKLQMNLEDTIGRVIDQIQNYLKKNEEVIEDERKLESEIENEIEAVNGEINTVKTNLEQIEKMTCMQVLENLREKLCKDTEVRIERYKKRFQKLEGSSSRTKYMLYSFIGDKNKRLIGVYQKLNQHVDSILVDYDPSTDAPRKLKTLFQVDDNNLYVKKNQNILQKLNTHPIPKQSLILCNEDILIIAGGREQKEGKCLAEAIIYEYSSLEFKELKVYFKFNMAATRALFSGCEVKNHFVFIAGNTKINKPIPIDTVEGFNLDSKKVSALSSLNEKKFGISSCVLDQSIYVFGGILSKEHNFAFSTKIEIGSFKSERIFTLQWRTVWSRPIGGLIGVSTLSKDEILIFGGLLGNKKRSDQTLIYNINEEKLREAENKLERGVVFYTEACDREDFVECFGIEETGDPIYFKYIKKTMKWVPTSFSSFSVREGKD